MTVDLILLGAVFGGAIVFYLMQSKLKDEQNNRKRLAGLYSEKFVAFSDKFKYERSDTYSLGMPIDFIVFDGLSAGKVDKIVIVEVKTNTSQLSQRESSIRDAVRNRRIEWEEIRL